MTAGAAIAFALFTGFAIGDWWSRLRHDRRVEYVCKPATLLALIAAAVLLDPAAGAADRRVWFVAALVCSLAGDVFLMLEDKFVFGLAAFLLAHCLYIAGFWTDPAAGPALAVSAVIALGALVPLAFRVLRSVRSGSEPALAGPVAAYIAVIAAMVVSAFASGIPAAAAGAALFAGSDSLIAWGRFVRPLAWASVAIMVTYHVGQMLLVVSLLD